MPTQVQRVGPTSTSGAAESWGRFVPQVSSARRLGVAGARVHASP